MRLRDLDRVEATLPREVAVKLVSGRSRAIGVLALLARDAELPVNVMAPGSKTGPVRPASAGGGMAEEGRRVWGGRGRDPVLNQPSGNQLTEALAHLCLFDVYSARLGTQAASHVDEDARALHQVEPAPVRPPPTVRCRRRVEGVSGLAGVPGPSAILSLCEWLAVAVPERLVAIHDAPGADAEDLCPRVVRSQRVPREGRHEHGGGGARSKATSARLARSRGERPFSLTRATTGLFSSFCSGEREQW